MGKKKTESKYTTLPKQLLAPNIAKSTIVPDETTFVE
jgi:hypothetical protein